MRDDRSAAPAVALAAKVLHALRISSPEWLSLSAIARRVASNKASVHRVVTTLHGANFVVRHPQDKTYTLGPALIELGAAAAGEGATLEIVRGMLPELASETGMSVEALNPLPDGRLVVVAGCTGPGPFTLNRHVGMQVHLSPAYAVLQFAWCGKSQLERLIEASASLADWQNDPAITEDVAQARSMGFVWSITIGRESSDRIPDVERWMDAAASHGCGRSDQEARRRLLADFLRFGDEGAGEYLKSRLSSLPVLGVAAPVFDAAGEVAFQVCAVSLLAQVPPQTIVEIGRTVARQSDRITLATGGRRPPA